jgi:short-subunit dehydrogenase
MGKWALVTGTTSGIGKSFCELLAREGYDLILVSRDLVRMNAQAETLISSYNIKIEILQADLTDVKQIDAVVNRCMDANKPIEVLVNNAGFGINSDFSKSQIELQAGLINCMIMAPMRLTHAVVKSMEKSKRGFIINVSSVAGYMAGSTYCSAKSWLTVFTESIYSELKNKGINIHAICPGFTKTEFHSRCEQDVTGVPDFVWLFPERVAVAAWNSVKKGKVICIPGIQYKGLVYLHQYAPRLIVRNYGKLAKRFLRRGGKNM